MPDITPLLDETRERVLRQYGYAIGQHRDELVTPALVLDIDAAQRNIDYMARTLRQMGGSGRRGVRAGVLMIRGPPGMQKP